MLHRDEDLIRLSAVWKPLWLCSSSSFYPFNYRPQTKLREGNVFTPVRDIVMGGLCWGGSLSRGLSVQEGLRPGGLCPRVSVQGSLYPWGSLSKGVSVQEGSLSWRHPVRWKSRRYTSYWNAFLFFTATRFCNNGLTQPLVSFPLFHWHHWQILYFAIA